MIISKTKDHQMSIYIDLTMSHTMTESRVAYTTICTETQQSPSNENICGNIDVIFMKLWLCVTYCPAPEVHIRCKRIYINHQSVFGGENMNYGVNQFIQMSIIKDLLRIWKESSLIVFSDYLVQCYSRALYKRTIKFL